MKKQHPPTLKVAPIFTLLRLCELKKKNLGRRCLEWKKEGKRWREARFIRLSTSLNEKKTLERIHGGKNIKAIASLAQVSAGRFASPKLWVMVVLGRLLSVTVALAQSLWVRRSGYDALGRSLGWLLWVARSRSAALRRSL